LRVFDLLLRVAGGILAALMGAGFALLEAMATPRPWFLAVGAALVGNAFLIWFAQSTLEARWAWLVPAVPWFVIMIVAVGPTSEGDLIANSWTGLGTLAAGTFVYFAAVAAGVPGKRGI
jgi:hypothetical protein